MSLHEVDDPLARWAAEGQAAAVATLVRVRHSAPRPPGARFAVSERGETAGSVSSGCVEGDLFEHLQRTLSGSPPRLVRYGITDEMAAEVGLACGGEIEVLVAGHDPADPAWQGLVRQASRPTEAAPPVRSVPPAEAAVLITGLSAPIRAHRLLLRSDGSREGTLGSAALDGAAASLARSYLERGDPEVVSVEDPEGEARLELFVEPFLPPPRLAIVGASPIAAALCSLAARLGYAVSVIDPRATFADPARFAGAERVLHVWPEDGLREVGLDARLEVVVLSHDEKLDVPALATALEAGCRYVGLLGGGRTQRRRREALRDLGFDDAALASIHGPVGLAIGARTPEEIALAIAAELVAERRRR